MANALWMLQKVPRCSTFMMTGGVGPSLSVHRVSARPMRRKRLLRPRHRLLRHLLLRLLHRLQHRLKRLLLYRLKFLKFILDGSLLLRLMLFPRLVLVCSLTLLLEPR